ncbi:MAG: hypothetical protein ACJ74Z_09325 [Bryobacteraceae bacterium]
MSHDGYLVESGYRLRTLYDMYQFELRHLLSIVGTVEHIEGALIIADRVFEAVDLNRLDFDLAEENIRIGLSELDALYVDCEAVDLHLCCCQIERLRKALVPGCGARDIATLFTELKNRIDDELKGRIFLSLPRADAEQYQQTVPFGIKAAEKFGRVLTDMQEAGKCLALDRPTACVFHLMRVMEYSVQRFGKKLGITLTDTKTWQTILNDLNAPIRAMPEKTRLQKKKKEEYAGVHAYLFNVKLAWRNPVMHPKATYTPEEAKDVFRHVNTFLRHLASIL